MEETCNLRNICLEREGVAFAASYFDGNAKEWFMGLCEIPSDQLVEFQVCSL